MSGDEAIGDIVQVPLPGVYYAVVTQNDDPDCRVKVRFPWLPGGDHDQSHWALIAAPMAGDKFGTYVLPEVDDTVVVAFVSGDIRFPVILGGVWNETDKPPEDNGDGKNEFRLIKSRSGHRLLFDDSDEVQVAFADKTNANQAGCGKFSGKKLKLAAPSGNGGKGVALSSLSGDLHIHCPNGKLTVKGMKVEVTAAAKLSVSAKDGLKAESSAPGKLCASQGAKFQGAQVKVG